MRPFFTIIIVCLNPGDRLKSTLESVEKQTFRDFEVIIKDGLSEDGSLSYAYALQKRWGGEKLKILEKRDEGIYDAMNQAAAEAAGSYIYFLNCGDWLCSENVLSEMAEFIKASHREGAPGIFYGDIFERLTGQRVASNPRIDAFACYRNVPCHQACFYSGDLLKMHPFETKYKVRADYEQFLWCFFEGSRHSGAEKVSFCHKNILIADYEGGGFSESKENRKISAAEHREITKIYMSLGQLFRFRLIMLLTLSPLRTYLAKNPGTAGAYHRLKSILYRRKREN
ncbi:MAG: glycosyltransferase [Clostridium sp.]|nr:glycosyltransferase [Clostridium sp.]